MYLPKHFKMDDIEIPHFIASYPFATLISASTDGPVVNFAPLIFDVENHTLSGHLANNNQQLSCMQENPLITIIFHGPDGYISTGLVGDVRAADRSAMELAGDIKIALANYVRNPEVTVIVQEANSTEFLQRVRITGAVRTPLSVPFSKGMTVLDLVLLAGGTTEFASANSAKLYRKTKEGTGVYPIYLEEILNKGKVESNYLLVPSDIVTVPERRF